MSPRLDSECPAEGAAEGRLPTLLAARARGPPQIGLPKALCVRNTFLETHACEDESPWSAARKQRAVKTCPGSSFNFCECICDEDDEATMDPSDSDATELADVQPEDVQSEKVEEADYVPRAAGDGGRAAFAPLAAPQAVPPMVVEAPSPAVAPQAGHFFIPPLCSGVLVPVGALPCVPGLPIVVAPVLPPTPQTPPPQLLPDPATTPAPSSPEHAPQAVRPTRSAPAALELGLGSAELPSVGSKAHSAGLCKPCAFLHTRGCDKGQSCNFCHLCDPEDRKRHRKAKQEWAQSIRKSKLLAFAGLSDTSATRRAQR